VTASLICSDARSRSVRAVVLAETLPAMGAAVALTVAELWGPASVSTLAAAPTVSALVYPSIYIAAAVVTLQAIIGGALRGYRRSVAGLVMGGMAAEAVAFGLWSPQLLAQTYVPGRTLIDPLFVLGLLMIGAGGTLAARRVENAPEVTEPARTGGIVPGLMFVLLLAALVQTHLGDTPNAVDLVLGAGLLFSALAFIARGGLLERRLRELLDRERAARAALAEREAELARLNAQLVEDSRRDPLTGPPRAGGTARRGGGLCRGAVRRGPLQGLQRSARPSRRRPRPADDLRDRAGNAAHRRSLLSLRRRGDPAHPAQHRSR
jgi:hypothetical protein